MERNKENTIKILDYLMKTKLMTRKEIVDCIGVKNYLTVSYWRNETSFVPREEYFDKLVDMYNVLSKENIEFPKQAHKIYKSKQK